MASESAMIALARSAAAISSRKTVGCRLSPATSDGCFRSRRAEGATERQSEWEDITVDRQEHPPSDSERRLHV
jgi:hypothetical protein